MYFDAKEFGKRLHDVRTSRGITQEELAVRLGLASKQHVSRMENGERSCSIDLLIELSCILHVSTDYLLMGSEPKRKSKMNVNIAKSSSGSGFKLTWAGDKFIICPRLLCKNLVG